MGLQVLMTVILSLKNGPPLPCSERSVNDFIILMTTEDMHTEMEEKKEKIIATKSVVRLTD